MYEVLAESLRNQIIVQAVGPLVTVFLGGIALALITRQFQIRDADQKLRESMARDVARIGGRFYSLAAAAMRANDAEDPELIGLAKKELESNFHRFIVDGGMLEKRLSAYSQLCYLSWHAASDCATVLYYILTGASEDIANRIININEMGYGGKEHSRLSRKDLRDPGKLMDQLAMQMNSINSETLRDSKNTRRRKIRARVKTGGEASGDQTWV
jgi:hypothetical protein